MVFHFFVGKLPNIESFSVGSEMVGEELRNVFRYYFLSRFLVNSLVPELVAGLRGLWLTSGDTVKVLTRAPAHSNSKHLSRGSCGALYRSLLDFGENIIRQFLQVDHRMFSVVKCGRRIFLRWNRLSRRNQQMLNGFWNRLVVLPRLQSLYKATRPTSPSSTPELPDRLWRISGSVFFGRLLQTRVLEFLHNASPFIYRMI